MAMRCQASLARTQPPPSPQPKEVRLSCAKGVTFQLFGQDVKVDVQLHVNLEQVLVRSDDMATSSEGTGALMGGQPVDLRNLPLPPLPPGSHDLDMSLSLNPSVVGDGSSMDDLMGSLGLGSSEVAVDVPHLVPHGIDSQETVIVDEDTFNQAAADLQLQLPEDHSSPSCHQFGQPDNDKSPKPPLVANWSCMSFDL